MDTGLIMEVVSNIFNVYTLFICFAGTLIGAVLGAIPGMNGGIGIAVMLPFTFTMNPAQGLLFLGGMYLGSSYGGSISGILMNCPGTAEAACTTMEGYPMTKAGKGKEALYYSVISSGFGSIVGILVLIFFTPVLSKIAVKFGPPEMMLLGMCGLTIVGSLTGKNVFKGMLAACIGLVFAMIGMDNATGAMRFTMGTRMLQGGVVLIPAVIGLFAIAEMVKQGESYLRSDDNGKVEKLEDTKVGYVFSRVLTKYRATLLKSSVLGTLIGVLPGTGAAISSFLAYGEAKSSSKEGGFGKGNPAGIVAAESANNAAVGGSLVPMLSLGIPGSATSAIMFGALTIHGLVPGQRLFVDHADIAYTFLVGMLLTAVFLILIGVLGIPIFASVLKIKINRIIPVVIVFSLIGAYSVNNSIYDAYVAVACGIIGVLINKVGIPNTPIVLGLILGSLVEDNFARTYQIVSAKGLNFFGYISSRPLSIAIVALTVYLIYANVKVMKREMKIAKEAQIDLEEVESAQGDLEKEVV